MRCWWRWYTRLAATRRRWHNTTTDRDIEKTAHQPTKQHWLIGILGRKEARGALAHSPKNKPRRKRKKNPPQKRRKRVFAWFSPELKSSRPTLNAHLGKEEGIQRKTAEKLCEPGVANHHHHHPTHWRHLCPAKSGAKEEKCGETPTTKKKKKNKLQGNSNRRRNE